MRSCRLWEWRLGEKTKRSDFWLDFSYVLDK
jgi:hypothetical protein